MISLMYCGYQPATFSILNMEAENCSEILTVTYHTTYRHISEDLYLNIDGHDIIFDQLTTNLYLPWRWRQKTDLNVW
jgi:hypothetical protein